MSARRCVLCKGTKPIGVFELQVCVQCEEDLKEWCKTENISFLKAFSLAHTAQNKDPEEIVGDDEFVFDPLHEPE